jgi:ABC-type nitrate/sulfonate/bicarbonate transport system permease component
MRIGIALCVIGVIVAEMLSSLGGVGYLISYHRTMFNTGHVYFSILIAIIFAYGVNRLLTFVERRFSAWRDTDP